jgi:hypothetical protein
MEHNMRFTFPLATLCSLRRFLAVTVLALLSATAPTFAATLYVDDLNDDQRGAGTSTNPYRDLQYAIDQAASGDTIFIRHGNYVATPVNFIDPTCGNCGVAEFYQNIPATRGFHVTGKSLILKGEVREGTVLKTRAGYGVLFEFAGTSRIENLTVTGGLRDPHGKATNAAVVARYTNLTVLNADLVDNNDLEDGLDPGVSGIAVREGGVLTAENVKIHRTSWDGIALYRSDPWVSGSAVRATIRNADIRYGDGAGIGATWDSQAEIMNSRISHFWKGVGSFGTARVTLRNSLILYQQAWGVLADHASNMTAINNVIAYSDRTGFFQISPNATVTVTNNIVDGNGWGSSEGWPEFPPVGIVLNNPERATVTYNDVYNNQEHEDSSPAGHDRLAGTHGNISADPLFNNPSAGDFSLPCHSPAVNTGALSISDIDGSRSDMGAYGGPGSSQLPPGCGRPDLQPTPFLGSGLFEEGSVIVFDSGVRNAGPVGIGGFSVKWFVDGVQMGHGGHAGVPANTTIYNDNSQFSWTATRGNHWITFTVDGTNSVLESNEDNNSYTLGVGISPPRADLTPTAITYNPADLVAGRQILFDSGVQNLKNVPTGNFHIKWFVNNNQVGYGVHTGVAGNATVLNENSAYRWTAASGTYTIRFVLDADSHVTESNEANNSRSIMVTVP